jgi:hypothetical protein
MGEDRLNALVQESLAVGVKTKALRMSDLSHVIVDPTAPEKSVMFPTDARLLDRARVRLVTLAKAHGGFRRCNNGAQIRRECREDVHSLGIEAKAAFERHTIYGS